MSTVEELQTRLGAALIDNRDVYKKLEGVRAELAALQKEPVSTEEWRDLAIRQAQAAVDESVKQQFQAIRGELEKTQKMLENERTQVARLEAWQEEALHLLRRLEWNVEGECPECRVDVSDRSHTPACALAELLAPSCSSDESVSS